MKIVKNVLYYFYFKNYCDWQGKIFLKIFNVFSNVPYVYATTLTLINFANYILLLTIKELPVELSINRKIT